MPDSEHVQTEDNSQLTSNQPDNSQPRVSRVFTGQHLDDHSTYHNRDSILQKQQKGDLEDKQSDLSEEVSREEREALQDKTPEEEYEVRDGIVNEKDLEAPLERRQSTKSAKEPHLVTWNGPDDPENPKNWSARKKWAATFIVSSFTFISPVSSSLVAPAIPTIAKDFKIKNEVEQQMVLSTFVLAYAVGPLFLGPLSEIFGRVPVLQLANLFYLVFNTACGGCKNKGEMIAFRFLAGLGGSAPLAIGGGVLSDCWRSEERGRAISIYSLAPLLGPAVGPIAGGFITENTTWRWAFYATSIADAIIQFAGVFLLQETYPPKLLHIKANKLRKETNNPDLHTEFEHPERSLANTLERSLIRPFKLLATQPIVQVLAVYMAYIYGLMYLVLSTFPVLWTERYHENLGISGLNYISMGLGFFLGAQIGARLTDRIYVQLKRKRGGVGKPEFRVPLIIPASVLVPTGLFIYAWTAQYRTHWIGPNIGICIFSIGGIVAFQCIQTYIVDSYTRFAASAIGAATVLRSSAGFGFPLFAPYMYAKLEYGWGNSLLAFVAIGLGVPAPFLLWFYGEKLRKKSPFAAGE